MSWWIPIVIAAAFVGGIVVASLLWKRDLGSQNRRVRREAGDFPFARSEQLLDKHEYALYRLLQQALGRDSCIFPKVRLADMVTLRKRTDRAHFYLGLVAAKHVDFLICGEDSLAPACAVLIRNTRHADELELITDILRSAALPMIQLQTKTSISPAELQMNVRKAIQEMGPARTLSRSQP